MPINQKLAMTSVGILTILIVAFFRGNQLLGVTAGIVYTILAAGTCFLLFKTYCTDRKTSRVRRILIAIFAFAVFAIGNFPAQYSPALGSWVEIRQQEIKNNKLLRNILAAGPSYEKLEFESIRWKCLVYIIRGQVESESELNRLRRRIFTECPDISQRWLYWDLTVEDSGQILDNCDLSIFGELEEFAE